MLVYRLIEKEANQGVYSSFDCFLVAVSATVLLLFVVGDLVVFFPGRFVDSRHSNEKQSSTRTIRICFCFVSCCCDRVLNLLLLFCHVVYFLLLE